MVASNMYSGYHLTDLLEFGIVIVKRISQGRVSYFIISSGGLDFIGILALLSLIVNVSIPISVYPHSKCFIKKKKKIKKK